MAVKVCQVCGVEFDGYRNAKYCGAKCKRIRDNKNHIRNPKRVNHHKRIKKNGNMRSIAELDAKAKELGISYGQYIAMLNV